MAKELLSNLPTPGSVTAISTLKNELKKGETTFELETGLAAYFETAESQFRLVCGHEILLVTKVESAGKKLTVTRNVGENSKEEDHPAKANVFNFVPREGLEKWVKDNTPTKFVNYVATSQGMPGEGAFALLTTPDELNFELAADTLCLITAAFEVSGPTNVTPTFQMYLDTAEMLNESGLVIAGGHTATQFSKQTLGSGSTGEGTKFTNHNTYEGASIGDGSTSAEGVTMWLKAGSHKLQIKFKGNTNNKAKERRIVVVAF